MPNRSSSATLGEYRLFANETLPIDETTGENWRATVLAPNGYPIMEMPELEGPWYQAEAQRRAERVAKEHAQRHNVVLPDVQPQWIEG
jgi:hypothetical protein